jgi:hypothetical protein
MILSCEAKVNILTGTALRELCPLVRSLWILVIDGCRVPLDFFCTVSNRTGACALFIRPVLWNVCRSKIATTGYAFLFCHELQRFELILNIPKYLVSLTQITRQDASCE